MLRLIAVLWLALSAAVGTQAAEPARKATLYKNPQCGCCEEYATYLRQHGFDVKVVATHDLALIKRERGVPTAVEGCHTMVLDDYVVEGHVPVSAINLLLEKQPQVRGISLPGMPQGSPGMTGRKAERFTVYSFGMGEPKVFAVE